MDTFEFLPKKQNPDLQINALFDAGIEEQNLFKDIASDVRTKHPQLQSSNYKNNIFTVDTSPAYEVLAKVFYSHS